MTLDRRRRSLKGNRLDHVGIKRALTQKARSAEGGGLFLEHVDERVADDAALLLGVEYAREPRDKKLGRVDDPKREAQPFREVVLHPLALACTQQSGVDEDTCEPVADRAMD